MRSVDTIIPGTKWLFFLPLFLLLFLQGAAHSFETTPGEDACGPEAESAKECVDVPTTSDNTAPLLPGPKAKKMPQPPLSKEAEEVSSGESKSRAPKEFTVYFFWGKGCPHCEEEKLFMAG